MIKALVCIFVLYISTSLVLAAEFNLITWECIFCKWSWVGDNPDRKQRCPKFVNGTHYWTVKKITTIGRNPSIDKNDLSSNYHTMKTISVK